MRVTTLFHCLLLFSTLKSTLVWAIYLLVLLGFYFKVFPCSFLERGATGGHCSLLTQQVLIWLHSGGFVCSTFIPLKHRKGRAAQAEGHCRDKSEDAFCLPYILVGSLSSTFAFTKLSFQGLLFFLSIDKSNMGNNEVPLSDFVVSSSFLCPGDPVLRRQSLWGLLRPHEGSSPLQLRWPQEWRRLYQCDRAEGVGFWHLPVQGEEGSRYPQQEDASDRHG